jgi:hypothetical protein
MSRRIAFAGNAFSLLGRNVLEAVLIELSGPVGHPGFLRTVFAKLYPYFLWLFVLF